MLMTYRTPKRILRVTEFDKASPCFSEVLSFNVDVIWVEQRPGGWSLPTSFTEQDSVRYQVSQDM